MRFESSSGRAWKNRVADKPGYRLASLFALSMLCSLAWADDSSSDPRVVFDIPQQRADLALTEFAEQADLTLVFPSDVAREKLANPLIGEYTLEEGVRILLSGTGLNPAFSNRVVLSVTTDDASAGEGDVMKTSKKAGLVAILIGMFAGGADAQEPAPAEQAAQTSVVTGRVTDARTGANLKGARVTIEETGQWTNTDSLGRFRFTNVPNGGYTLTISFLGYAGQSTTVSVDGLGAILDFKLRGGTEVEEIVVFGQRSARMQALNQERTAPNSMTVISSDLLGDFTGTTISDSLRRAPGMALVRDGDTGDGQNIIVRGLEPNLNEVTLNGVRVPDTSGIGRAADLSGLLADSVSEIRLSTTLLPSQDSAGTGALVEIETRSPLDRPERYFDVGIEGTFRDDDYGEDFLATSTASGIFGSSGNFGLSGSVQYREQDVSSGEYLLAIDPENLAEYYPLGDDGLPITSIFGINPLSRFPFEEGVDSVYVRAGDLMFTSTQSETFTGTLTADWQVSRSTKLRLDHVYTVRETDSFSRAVDISQATERVVQPIDALGGEERAVLSLATVTRGGEEFFRIIGAQDASASFDQRSETNALSIRGETLMDAWDFHYRAGYSRGESESPQVFSFLTGTNASLEDPSQFFNDTNIDVTELLPGAFNPITGAPVNVFGARTGRGFPQLLVNESGLAEFSNLDVGFGSLGRSAFSGESDVLDLSASVRRNFDASFIDYLEVGVQFERNEFSDSPGAFTTTYQGELLRLSGPTRISSPRLDELGVTFSPDPISVLSGQPLMVLDPAGVESLFRNIVSFVDQSFNSRDDWSAADRVPLSINSFRTLNELSALTADSSTVEESFETYFQMQFTFGDWDVIGGARVSSTEAEATFVNTPTFLRFDPDTGEAMTDDEFAQRFTRTEQLSRTQTDVLPRISANYRPNQNIVVRGSYYRTVARPRIRDLNQQQSVTLDERPIFELPDGSLGPRLVVSSGNPDLKPALTDNFEIGFEYYTENAGAFKVRVFYKETDNLLELNEQVDRSDPTLLSDIALPDDAEFLSSIDEAGDALVVLIRQPINNPDSADLIGAELVGEYQFQNLPGPWSGLGFYGNYTYTDSEKTFVATPPFSDEEFRTRGAYVLQSPHTYTGGITYSYGELDGSLFYTYQSETDVFGFYGLGRNNAEQDSLDLRLQYVREIGRSTVRFFLEGSDLLRDETEADVETLLGSDIYTGGFYRGGRFWTVGMKASF